MKEDTAAGSIEVIAGVVVGKVVELEELVVPGTSVVADATAAATDPSDEVVLEEIELVDTVDAFRGKRLNALPTTLGTNANSKINITRS